LRHYPRGKKKTLRPASALQVERGDWPAYAVQHWAIENTKPHQRNVRTFVGN